MNRKKIIGIVFAVFIMMVVLLTFFSNTIANYTLAKVIVTHPTESSLIKQVSARGTVEPLEIQNVYFQGGVVTEVSNLYCEEGDKVYADEILMHIKEVEDKTDLQIERIKLEKMHYLYEQAQKASTNGENLITLEQNAASLEWHINNLQEKVNELRTLYDSGVATINQLREAEKSLEEMKISYRNSKENLDIARENEGKALTEAKYNLDIQSLVVQQLEEKYQYDCDIKAEFTGLIHQIHVDEGSRIGNNSLLISIIRLDAGFEFTADMDVDKADFIQSGDPAQVRILNWKDNNDIMGTVDRIGHSSANKGIAKEVAVLLAFHEASEENEHELTGYESGELYVEKGTGSFSMVVPNSALIPGLTKELKYLWLIEEKKGFLGSEYYVKKIEVMVLEEDNYHSAIQGSILPEDRIVIHSDKILYDNSRVLLDESD